MSTFYGGEQLAQKVTLNVGVNGSLTYTIPAGFYARIFGTLRAGNLQSSSYAINAQPQNVSTYVLTTTTQDSDYSDQMGQFANESDIIQITTNGNNSGAKILVFLYKNP